MRRFSRSKAPEITPIQYNSVDAEIQDGGGGEQKTKRSGKVSSMQFCVSPKIYKLGEQKTMKSKVLPENI